MHQTRKHEVRFSREYGLYHVHRCERCGVEVACFDGDNCMMPDNHGHCSQECYNHKTAEGSRTDQPVVFPGF
jgi:hypothetical protein